MATVTESSAAELFSHPDFNSLIEQYSEECSIPELRPHSPDKRTYLAMEAAGILKIFAAWDHSELIGFLSVTHCTLPHYSKKVATIESFFVLQKFRRTGIGIQLLEAAKDYARSIECQAVLISAPTNGTFEKLLEAMKCRQTNSVFLMPLS